MDDSRKSIEHVMDNHSNAGFCPSFLCNPRSKVSLGYVLGGHQDSTKSPPRASFLLGVHQESTKSPPRAGFLLGVHQDSTKSPPRVHQEPWWTLGVG